MAEPVVKQRMSPTAQIMLGLLIGLIVGYVVSNLDPETKTQITNIIRPFSQIFIRMIRMIIAPLLFGTLVVGIAGAGHFKDVGRLGLRAIIYFEIVTTIALFLGLVVVNVMQPGVGVTLPAPTGAPPVTATAQTWDQIFLHLIPTSIIEAMATGDVLQIVVFSVVFGIGLGMVGERGKPMLHWCEALTEAMFKVTHIVMLYAPIGVGAAIAYTVGTSGLSVLRNLAYLILTFYVALAIFFLLVLIPVMIMFRIKISDFARAIKEPAIIAFSTTSSEAALPRAMEVLEAYGVPRRIVSFVLPLGYSFNLDGTTLYLSMASIFVAQAAGVELTIGQQIGMMLMLMLTSKGVAGVPRAALVILAATVASYNLPLEGVTLVLGVDALMDMGRTATNVIGNCLASVVVAKWEGQLPADAGTRDFTATDLQRT
ncbi:MAG TPA: cation:dicarboxylase symporter family transporter [Vicinamibacterales bacterium]|nr:cation:dicarboxylase symporter family transporter [Vicinamibacterales bacterium]